MVKFLTTTQISAELENMIKSAEKEIIIISPYLKVNQRLQDFMEDANLRKIHFALIYGKKDLQKAELDWIDRLGTVETGFVPNLHAKCYLNEATAIVTSMNLYEFSQQNNDEMGILVARDGDSQLFQDIHAEAQRLGRKAGLKWSEPTTAKRKASPKRKANQGSGKSTRQVETGGHCIRCGDNIDLDTAKPFCGTCYRSWVKFKNESYPEKYCHNCGKQKTVKFAKPLCSPCYKASGSK